MSPLRVALVMLSIFTLVGSLPPVADAAGSGCFVMTTDGTQQHCMFTCRPGQIVTIGGGSTFGSEVWGQAACSETALCIGTWTCEGAGVNALVNGLTPCYVFGSPGAYVNCWASDP